MAMTISAKVIADSISANGDRITTYELEYPRFIHSELMTHRAFSRNAASSRAIPIGKMLDMVENNPAMPSVWGLNQPGMQAGEVHNFTPTCHVVWKQSARAAVKQARALQNIGLHKQIVNRVVEPFAWMKVVVTATEYDNWFWLRSHKDAQPEIRILSDMMYTEYNNSAPMQLKHGEWHLPYVTTVQSETGIHYRAGEDTLTLKGALKVSASCCAQVSYRLTDNSLEKAIKIYDQLVEMTPVHASPFEHQATPMEYPTIEEQGTFHEPGTTHYDLDGNAWSGNFKSWTQNRQLIPGNTCWEYNNV
jgi:hypothetical protein